MTKSKLKYNWCEVESLPKCRKESPSRYLLIFAIIFFFQAEAFAQVGISNTTIIPDASSILELKSTSAGFLSPRMTTTQRDAIASPAKGLSIFNLDTNQFNYYDGTIWKILGSASGWALNDNSGTTVGNNFLGTTDGQDFSIYTNNVERIRVQSGGNVGIGTSSPQRLFHVLQNSSGTPSMFALDNPNTTDGNGMSLSFRGTTTGAGAASFKEFSAIQSVFDIHEYATRASSLVFFTSASGSIAERMRIGSTGNIGIGTTTPNSYLETAGSFGTGIITTTTDISLDKTHYTVIVTGGSPFIDLPIADIDNNRRSYRIINQNSSAIKISSYIDFTGTSANIVEGNSKIELQSDGKNWYRVD